MTLSRGNVEVPIESYEELYDMLASGTYRALLNPKGALYQLHVENNDTEIMRRIGAVLHKYPPVARSIGSKVALLKAFASILLV